MRLKVIQIIMVGFAIFAMKSRIHVILVIYNNRIDMTGTPTFHMVIRSTIFAHNAILILMTLTPALTAIGGDNSTHQQGQYVD